MGYFYDIFDDFLSLLFPRLCHGCGSHLGRGEDLVCLECIISIPRTGYHTVRDNPVEQLLWGRCYIERAAALSFYTKGSRIRKIVHSIKYKGNRELGIWTGRFYGGMIRQSGFLDGITVLVPVPLHRRKIRSRGFNQSELICTGITEVTGIATDTESLQRVSFTDTQTKRSRFERWKNVEGIFKVVNPGALEGKHILLVDDVITTGSTVEACANELLKVEGVKVSVLALAVAVQ